MSDLNVTLTEYFRDGGTQKEINAIVREILSRQPRLKVVINTCFGGYSLSSFALESLGLAERDILRTDDRLIALIEEEGTKKVSGYCTSLKIVEAPVGSDWSISNYDGLEDLVW